MWKKICKFPPPAKQVVFITTKEKNGNPVKSRLPAHLKAGDERIELPPKVLETPIIPFDQSPVFIKTEEKCG